MKKILTAALMYGLQPFLIYQYASTGEYAYKFVLGFLVAAFFLFMLLFTAVTLMAGLRMSPDEGRKIRDHMRTRAVSSVIHLAMGLAIGYAIFVHVNSILGVVHIGSLLMVQILRWRLLRGYI